MSYIILSRHLSKNGLDWELLEMQRRGQDFFGGTLRPFKGYHAPHAGCPGGQGPRMVAKFPFLNNSKY